MLRVQRAIERLYEESSLIEDLTDAEAAPLLKYAEDEIRRLNAFHTEDAAFDEAISKLWAMLGAMARYIGRLTYTTPEDAQKAGNALSDAAEAYGITIYIDYEPEEQSANSDDNIAAMRQLIAFLHMSRAMDESPGSDGPFWIEDDDPFSDPLGGLSNPPPTNPFSPIEDDDDETS